MSINQVFIGLGTNIGNKQLNIAKAKALLVESSSITILHESSIIETEPYGVIEQDEFLNQIIEVKTSLGVEEVLLHCQQVETNMGRIRAQHWGPRIIDLDILFFNESVIERGDLVVPHPDMQNRRFVLQNLMELCPEFIHPRLKCSIKELWDKLLEKQSI